MPFQVDVHQIFRKLLPLAFAALLAGSACGPPPVPDQPVGEAPPPPTRPPDGLLGNPALQHVVDLQVARDGAGLMALLGSDDAAVRGRAAYALASVQDPGAGSALAGLLADPDPGVRRDAAFALGQLMDPMFGPSLMLALRDEEAPEVRERILEAVGKAGDGRILEAFLALDLPEEEEAARNLAVSRMGIRGVALPTSINHLVASVTRGTGLARNHAAYYFGRNASPQPWAGSAPTLRSVLDSLPPADPVAMHLLTGLSLLGDPGDNPRFLAWMRSSPDWRIRVNAARATTGRLADVRVREGLLDAMEEPSTHVAVAAAEALASVRQLPPPEREVFKNWVNAHPRDWRRAGPILSALARMGEGPFLRAWIEALPPEEVTPRVQGLRMMATVPAPEATGYLMEMAVSQEPRIRATALSGLARRFRIEPKDPGTVARYFEVLSGGLRADDMASVRAVAPALGDSAFLALGSVAVLMNFYDALSLPEHQDGMEAILRALGLTGAPEAGEFLLRALNAQDGGIRAAAARAMAALEGEEPEEVSPGEAQRQVDWESLAELGPRPRLVLETEKGIVTLVLDAESAPLTVQTIAGFAREGLYDDTPFHRIVPNFVIQGGDFSRQDGSGGPGFSIRSEFTQIPYRRGVLGMASSGKDTEGSQFFITHSMAPHLDGGYTAFGWVESGMDVVDSIFLEDRIVRASVEPDGR